MGDQYYRNFFYILKRFAKDNNYKLLYELFGTKYELKFDGKYQVFYITFEGVKKYIGFKDTYKIIKENVQKRLQYMQTSKFKYHSKDKNKNLILSEKENKIYSVLSDIFRPYLYKEYIITLSVFENVDIKILQSVFYDLDISVVFLREILNKANLNEAIIPKTESNYTLFNGIWNKELRQFHNKGYINIKQKDNVVNEILFTEKFLDAIKEVIILSFI